MIRDFDGTPFLSLLKHLIKVEGVQQIQRMTVSPTATSDPDASARNRTHEAGAVPKGLQFDPLDGRQLARRQRPARSHARLQQPPPPSPSHAHAAGLQETGAPASRGWQQRMAGCVSTWCLCAVHKALREVRHCAGGVACRRSAVSCSGRYGKRPPGRIPSKAHHLPGPARARGQFKLDSPLSCSWRALAAERVRDMPRLENKSVSRFSAADGATWVALVRCATHQLACAASPSMDCPLPAGRASDIPSQAGPPEAAKCRRCAGVGGEGLTLGA